MREFHSQQIVNYMFNTFQEAYDARENNCDSTETFRIKNTTIISIGTELYVDPAATILAGTGYVFGGDNIFTLVNGTVTGIFVYP